MAAAKRKYNDLADLEAAEAAERGAPVEQDPEDRIIDDTAEFDAHRRSVGEVEGVGEEDPIDFPINSLEDLEKRDRILAARGASRGVSNDVMARLNYIPTGGLKLVAPSSQADRMQRILAMVGPDAFREMVKEGLV